MCSSDLKFPVCDGVIDRVIGYVDTRDILVRLLNKKSVFQLNESSIRTVLIIPDTLTLSELLDRFRATKETFAVVINEYALVVGVIIELSTLVIPPELTGPTGHHLQQAGVDVIVNGAPVTYLFNLPAFLPKTNTPDALLSAQTTMRGQNMTDARARDAGTDRLNVAGAIAAGDHQRSGHGAIAGAALGVRGVDSRSAQAHQDLATPGHGVGLFADAQHLARGAIAFIPGGFHIRCSSVDWPCMAHGTLRLSC